MNFAGIFSRVTTPLTLCLTLLSSGCAWFGDRDDGPHGYPFTPEPRETLTRQDDCRVEFERLSSVSRTAPDRLRKDDMAKFFQDCRSMPSMVDNAVIREKLMKAVLLIDEAVNAAYRKKMLSKTLGEIEDELPRTAGQARNKLLELRNQVALARDSFGTRQNEVAALYGVSLKELAASPVKEIDRQVEVLRSQIDQSTAFGKTFSSRSSVVVGHVLRVRAGSLDIAQIQSVLNGVIPQILQ